MTTATTTTTQPQLPTVLFDVHRDPEGSPACVLDQDRIDQAFAQLQRDYSYDLVRNGSIIGTALGKERWCGFLTLTQRKRIVEALRQHGVAALHDGYDRVRVIWRETVKDMAKAPSLTEVRALEAAYEHAQCECDREATYYKLVLAGVRQDEDFDNGDW